MNYKKLYYYLIFISLFTVYQSISAQTTIKTLTALKHKCPYTFSPDWQYLSTDLYLLNPQKFSNLLNDIALANSGGKKKRKISQEFIQSLFIKAKIQNLKFFGGDIIYPIYNFKASENKDYTTIETGNVEVVRLIDYLPLNESNEVIDAEISGEVITQKNSNEFLKLIGVQLQGLSKNSKPNIAILDLIGELGKYIESKTTGKQYKFSSTIRLYEGQDFNKKLHSINVFVFAPSTFTKVNIMAENLINYLDSAEQPEIDQEKLTKLISYRRYPMVIIANYKSRYNSQLIIGDQINFDYLNKRKIKIQNAFENELINKTTYNQELKLIEFLEFFADLKLNINNYKLNLKNNITNDYSKNLFVILKIYRDLLKAKNLRLIQFHGDNEFENEFLPKYESVITTAGLYLNEQNSLTNIKQVAELMEMTGNEESAAKNSDIAENRLRLLYSVKIPKDETNSEQAKEINRLAANLEQNLYSQTFLPLIVKVNQLPTDENGPKEKEKIENNFGNTYCKKCKAELSAALNDYNTRYQKSEKNKLLQKNEEIRQKTVSVLFKSLEQKRCIEKIISQSTDSLSTYNDLISIELKKLSTLIDDTSDLLKTDNKNAEIQQISEQNFMLEAYIRKLETGFTSLCKNISNNCECTSN